MIIIIFIFIIEDEISSNEALENRENLDHIEEKVDKMAGRFDCKLRCYDNTIHAFTVWCSAQIHKILE
ncbi:hypothetical protein T12_10718 [Trichinella patagoniensis]|uniref:Uncharacterized protein n=1 Tax=Trichinella patagoniensis TaxID=990121 RepID=A0A0V0ZV04_9BILA|nr:hypothetical protein T12_10718 [Trichinella patagoniensis]